jgi:murein DD-endopeptidase MepM/ murein hydrolase activator NlpD
MTERYFLSVASSKVNLRRIDRTSSPAHTGKLKYAIDFIVPENTQVPATAEGAMTYIKDDSRHGGSDVSYWNHSNSVVIMHENGEYSRYDHLAYHCSRVAVAVGQRVSAKHTTARMGITGYTFKPHLHFQVFVATVINIWSDFMTVEVKNFLD